MLLHEIYSGIDNSPDDYARDASAADKIYTAQKQNISAFWASNNVNEYFNIIFYINNRRYKFQIDRYDNDIPMEYLRFQRYVDDLVKKNEFDKLLQYLNSQHVSYTC